MSATDQANQSGQASATPVGPVLAPASPANMALPVVSGTAQDGQSLSVSSGSWSSPDVLSYGYQWQRCDSMGANCSDIPGAVGSGYTLTSADVGGQVVAVVSAIDQEGQSAQASSAAYPSGGVVRAVVPANVTAPSISGTAQATQTLTANPGAWSGSTPLSYSYQWQRCNSSGGACANVSGVTSQTYLLAAADVGATLVVAVTANNLGGSATSTSQPSAVINPAPPQSTAAPAISGAVLDGQKITTTLGSWSSTLGSVTTHVEWQRCDAAGANCANLGATGTSHNVLSADVGHDLTVVVSATDKLGQVSYAAAVPVGPVPVPPPPGNTTLPTVSGTPQDGQTLSASGGVWSSPDQLAYRYQWQRCDSTGANCAKLSTVGANYTAGRADIGHDLRALVSATDKEGQTTQVTTAAVGPVLAPAPPPSTAPPVISGTAQDGQTLTTTSGSWKSPDPLTYAYQWLRCDGTGANCASVTGVTQMSYPLSSADVGHVMKVTVTATDKENQTGSATAAAFGPVAAPSPPANTVAPTVAGNLYVGDTLFASPGAWTSPDRLALAYQWQRCDAAGANCANIANQTSSSYTLTSADVGDELTAVVTATDLENQSAQLTAKPFGPATVATSSPIVYENSLTGDSAWTQHQNAAPATAIQGYSSEVSVSPGGTLHLHVSSGANYRIEIDRLGWYGGAGGRRVTCIPSCSDDEPGQTFGTPSPDPTTGELDAGWPVTDTVAVGANWTTGYYLAMFVLTSGPNAGKTSWYPFIVTPPAGSHPAILVQVPVNTWQAYNPWPGPNDGGQSLYNSNSAGGHPAVKVSFNRPLMVQYQSVVFGREYQAVRWLERQGYDVGYYTDVDVDQNPAELLDQKVDMVLGHDEYWSMGMRQGWDTARANGHNLVFMGADIGSWQVRYEDNWRTLVEYRAAKADPEPNPELKTMYFRNLPDPPMPECELGGVQYDGILHHPGGNDYTVTAAAANNPWILAAGLQPGDALHKGVAYEWDKIVPGCQTPPLTDLLHYAGPSGTSDADAVTFTDPSGGQVFSAGSDQITLLLDAYNSGGQSPDPKFQAFMAAMLDSFGV